MSCTTKQEKRQSKTVPRSGPGSGRLPKDTEAERFVLGSLLIQPERLEEVVKIVGPADFTDSLHSSIFGLMIEHRRNGKPIDGKLLATGLKDECDSPLAILAEIAESVPHAANVCHYALIVSRLAVRRNLVELGDDVTAFCRNGKPNEEIIADLGYQIDEIRRKAYSNISTGLVTMSTVKQEAVPWVWESWIPAGMLTLLDGDPDVGKSTIAFDLASRVSQGWAFPPDVGGDRVYDPADVLLLSAEDIPRHTVAPRLEASGGDLSRIHQMVSMPGGDLLPELPRDIPHIQDRVQELGVSFVVIDPWNAFVEKDVDTYKDSDVRRVLHRLAVMAEETGVCVLLIRHFTKDKTRGAKHRGGGSVGIIGAARAGLVAGEDPDDEDCRILAVSKSNLAPRPRSLRYRIRGTLQHDGIATSKIEWLGTCDVSANEVATGTKRKVTKLDECRGLLEELLADGPRDADEVIAICQDRGHSDKTIKRARSDLGVKAEKHDFRGGWRLRLTECNER